MANMTNLTHITMENNGETKKFFARYERELVYQVEIAHPVYTNVQSMVDGKMTRSQNLKAIRTTTRTKTEVEKLEITAQEAKELIALIALHSIPHRIMNDGQVIEIMEVE